MQCEREALHVVALTNMAALTGERVVMFVIRNLSVLVLVVNCYEIQPH